MLTPHLPPDPSRSDSLIPEMITTKELAELIGVPVATLNNWRSIGNGPQFPPWPRGEVPHR